VLLHLDPKRWNKPLKTYFSIDEVSPQKYEFDWNVNFFSKGWSFHEDSDCQEVLAIPGKHNNFQKSRNS
jgi:hypothetical protein